MIDIVIDNIYPYPDKKLTCFERPLYAYINWLGKDPTYLGLASWSFTDNYVKEFKGIRNNAPMRWIIDGVKDIYDIDLLVKYITNANESIKVVKSEIEEKNPVMVYVDSFYCPWYPSYYKSHINHYVLVVGVTKDNDFICLDKTTGDSIYKILPIVDYIHGRNTGEVILFRNTQKNVDVQYAAGLFLKKQLIKMKDSDLFENIRSYSFVIRNEFNIKNELDGVHDYRVAAIYTWLKGISTSREKFAFALKNCIVGVQERYIQELLEISVQWKNVLFQLMLAKERIISFNYVAEILMNIADKEECCFVKIQQDIERRFNGASAEY